MSWGKVLEAHTLVAARIYAPEIMGKLAKECGLKISATGGATASSAADVDRYLKAVEKVLGGVALMSAKMKISGKKRQLGL